MASVTLKQADIDLLVAVCKQFDKVDTKQLAVDLGLNASAAAMRWRRFKEKTFGEKKAGEQAENGEEGESEVKTPPSKAKGGKKNGASGGSGKKGSAKRGREGSEIDGEATPSKKAATKKGARGKKAAQVEVVKAEENGESEQFVNGEEEGDGFVENDERLEDGLQQEVYEDDEEQFEE